MELAEVLRGFGFLPEVGGLASNVEGIDGTEGLHAEGLRCGNGLAPAQGEPTVPVPWGRGLDMERLPPFGVLEDVPVDGILLFLFEGFEALLHNHLFGLLGAAFVGLFLEFLCVLVHFVHLLNVSKVVL